MPKQVLTGIVLRTVDYRESDRILSVFTKERGLVAVSSRGCRKQTSKLAAFSSQFCYGEMEVTERAGKLQLTSASLLQSFYPIRESYEQLVSATRAVKIVERLIVPDYVNEQLLLLLYNVLSVIAYGDNEPKDIELCFLAKLLKLAGYTPVMTSCVKCGKDLRGYKQLRFSAELGGALCENCAGKFMYTSARSMEALRRMIPIDLGDIRRVKLPEDVRRELEPLLYNYAEYVMDISIKM